MADGIDTALMREAAAAGRIQWHQHALERLLERGISRAEVVQAILNGEVIETYPKDYPCPSCLILSVEDGVPLHVVAAASPADGVCHLVTAYRHTPTHFEPDFRTRRRRHE